MHDHPHPHLVRQRADDRKQPRDAQGLHEEETHRDLDHDDDQRRDIGGAEGADEARAADHLGHRPRDQREVDRRAGGRNGQHQRRDEEVDQRRRGQHRDRPVLAAHDLLILLHVTVDGLRALHDAADALVDALERLLDQAPVGHHLAQQRVTLARWPCDSPPWLRRAPSPWICGCRKECRRRALRASRLATASTACAQPGASGGTSTAF